MEHQENGWATKNQRKGERVEHSEKYAVKQAKWRRWQLLTQKSEYKGKVGGCEKRNWKEGYKYTSGQENGILLMWQFFN